MILKTWWLFLSGLTLLVVGYVVKRNIDDAAGVCMMITGFVFVIADRVANIFRWGLDE